MRQCGAKTLVHCTSRLPAAALRLQLNRILLRSDLSANDTALPSVRELPAKLENLLARVSSITVWRRPGVWIDFPLARVRKAEGLACLIVGVPPSRIIQDDVFAFRVSTLSKALLECFKVGLIAPADEENPHARNFSRLLRFGFDRESKQYHCNQD